MHRGKNISGPRRTYTVPGVPKRTDPAFTLESLAPRWPCASILPPVVTLSRPNDATPIKLSKNPALRFAQKSQIAIQKIPGLPPRPSPTNAKEFTPNTALVKSVVEFPARQERGVYALVHARPVGATGIRVGPSGGPAPHPTPRTGRVSADRRYDPTGPLLPPGDPELGSDWQRRRTRPAPAHHPDRAGGTMDAGSAA
jgi:hypothetical protein